MARLGKQKRPKDDIWTFGETVDKGYAKFCGESVHRIVAFAFLGEPPTKQHVVDHIDTNRQNNRPDNLRWLTKLENILLNSITKAKIEYLFGSVDEFLKDPSRLKGHDGEDSNFSWMRAVSPQEAKNTLANWERLLNKPRPVSIVKGNAIEEWIFNKNHSVKTSDSLLDLEDPFDFHQGYEVAELEKKDANASEVKPETSIDSPASPYAEEKEHAEASSISKRVFMSALINICERVGVQYVKYYKSQNWKSDVLIRIGDQRG